MEISVIIPTWQRAGILKETLDSLAGCDSLRAEIVVVCDGEDEATRELARSYAGAPVEWVFHQQNLGLAAARNTGAARARGEVLLFLDDDAVAAPGLVGFHARVHEGAGKIAVCGRIVESAQVAQRTKTGGFLEQAWMRTLESYEAARSAEETEQIPADGAEMSCFGLNCSVRREVFEALGGFNALLREMDEERELGWRMYLRGVRFVSEPRAVVFHKNDKDMVAYFCRCWRLGGSCDALRAVQLGQHNAQTRPLLGLDTGPVLQRWANRAFWYGGGAARKGSEWLQGVTERTGSRWSFRLWHEMARRPRYWEAVREWGLGREQLRELVGNPVRVLMLHSIATPQDAQEASFYLSPERFRKLLETMKAEGYCYADPRKLEDAGAQWGARELVLTFDDGYEDFYTEVLPLVEEYGLKPLVLLVAERIGDENRWDQATGYRARRLLNAAQIKELQRHGVRFGSHTLTHPSLPGVDDGQLRRELAESKHRLEELLGEEVNTFAYPFGHANRRVRAAVIEAGYKVAFTTVSGLNVWQDPFAMQRTEINELLPPGFYGWKLRTGLGPMQSMKYELMPLMRMIPREMRKPLRAGWRRVR